MRQAQCAVVVHGSQLMLALKSHFRNILESGELVIKPLLAWYQPFILQFSLVAQSCPTLCHPMDCITPGLPVHHQLLEITQTHVHWVHVQWDPTIASSVIPFSSLPHSFPVSRSFPISQLFTSGGQSTGVSASASVLPMNSQDWFHLGWTGCISSLSRGVSRVFSNNTVQKQFFQAQLSL